MTGSMTMGFVMELISLIGLILASRAADSGMYANGLAIFCFGIFFVFRMIHKYAGGRNS